MVPSDTGAETCPCSQRGPLPNFSNSSPLLSFPIFHGRHGFYFQSELLTVTGNLDGPGNTPGTIRI